MKDVYIVSAARTPVGSFGGKLAQVPATELGSIAIKAALEKAKLDPAEVQEVLMGAVLQGNLGQAPARQAAKGAGLRNETVCTTINKVCASGMKSITLGAQSIMLGHADVVVAGGMENMSMAPYYLPKGRYGNKYGHGEILDAIVKDGLLDPYHNYPMGVAGELCAAEKNITREDQDQFAIRSYQRAAKGWAEGFFKNEVAPVVLPQKKGDPIVIDEDEEYKNVKFDKIPGLSPVFKKDGTITAANASTINDGASAVVLMSGEKVKALGLKPLARIVSFADAELAPEWFTMSPSASMPLALKHAGLTLNDMDLFEINEAFSVVCIANQRALNLDEEKVNVFGGAVSLGHPLGSSGSRIVVTLTHLLQHFGKRYGLAGICNGGGGSTAIVIERV